jgi:uncharacterized membrane protein
MATVKRKHAPDTSSPQDKKSLERIEFFSDAVMAIAITLLVIDLKLPDIPVTQAARELPLRLTELTPRIISFMISFSVIAIYWTSHHRYFSYIERYDGRLIGLNFVFLFFIALMPFFASLLGQYGFNPVGVISYSLLIAMIGFSIGAIWIYASHHHRLISPDITPGFIRSRSVIAMVVPLVFLISAPFAWLSPQITVVIWWLIPITSMVLLRAMKSR